jgi:MFS family permease
MMFGRGLFGLGGESLEVAQASITTDWFQDHGLAFALGCNISNLFLNLVSGFARIAAALNDNLSPWIAERFSVGVAGWIGAGMCYGSAIVGVILLKLDRKEYRIKANVPVDEQDDQDANDSNKSSDRLVEVSDTGYESEEYDEEDDQIHFSQAKGFTLQFWILFLITVLLYGSVQPFFHICTAYFQSGKWPDMDPMKAGAQFFHL